MECILDQNFRLGLGGVVFGGMAQGLRALTTLAEDKRLGSQHLAGHLQSPMTPIPGAHAYM